MLLEEKRNNIYGENVKKMNVFFWSSVYRIAELAKKEFAFNFCNFEMEIIKRFDKNLGMSLEAQTEHLIS